MIIPNLPPHLKNNPKKHVDYFECSAEIVHDKIKRGKARRFEIICDEPARIGGLEIAPTPLEYFALGILF